MKKYSLICLLCVMSLYSCIAPKMNSVSYTEQVNQVESGLDLLNQKYQLLDVGGNASKTLEIQEMFLKDLNQLSKKPITLVSAQTNLLTSPTLPLNPSKEQIAPLQEEVETQNLINLHVNHLKDDLYDIHAADGAVTERSVEVVIQVYELSTGKIKLDNRYVGRIADIKEENNQKAKPIDLDLSKSLQKLSLSTYKEAWKHLKQYSIY